MRTRSTTTARDTVAPTLHKAQDTLNGTVLPAVRDAFTTAREKGIDFLDSDVALEARRRGLAVVHAAKGQPVVAPTRRWRFGLGMIAIGGALGYAIAWVAGRMATPIDSYTQTMPVPSGTDGGNVTIPATGSSTAAPSGTPTDEINLHAGAPTKF